MLPYQGTNSLHQAESHRTQTTAKDRSTGHGYLHRFWLEPQVLTELVVAANRSQISSHFNSEKGLTRNTSRALMLHKTTETWEHIRSQEYDHTMQERDKTRKKGYETYHKPRISPSLRLTCFPGRAPRTSKSLSMIAFTANNQIVNMIRAARSTSVNARRRQIKKQQKLK